MRERPILFTGAMVRAILSGQKTQTRRLCKLPMRSSMPEPELLSLVQQCPYGTIGDRLWVRESLGYCSEYGHYFKAGDEHGGRVHLCSLFDDEERGTGYSYEGLLPERAVPSIHLPRKYSRIQLELTGVRIERLQDISEADARAEGARQEPRCLQEDDTDAFRRIGPVRDASFPIARYAALWESINGPGSWAANPFVWCVSFRRVEP